MVTQNVLSIINQKENNDKLFSIQATQCGQQYLLVTIIITDYSLTKHLQFLCIFI